MFFSSPVPMRQVSIIIILSLYNISSATPVVGVSQHAMICIILSHEPLISPFTQCCKANNNNKNNNNNRVLYEGGGGGKRGGEGRGRVWAREIGQRKVGFF